MKVWTDLLGSKDSPYDIELDTPPGAKYEVRPPWPNLEIVSNDVSPVKEVVHQVVRVKASMPEDGVEQDLLIARLVARLEDGGEIEFERIALPTESIVEDVDITRCAACGEGIVPGDATILEVDGERRAYHSRCTT